VRTVQIHNLSKDLGDQRSSNPPPAVPAAAAVAAAPAVPAAAAAIAVPAATAAAAAPQCPVVSKLGHLVSASARVLALSLCRS